MESTRTQIYLRDDENAVLERESRATGKSKSQLIRDAIDRVYLGRDTSEILAALKASAGQWKRAETGAAWVERRRSGRLARLYGARDDLRR